MDYQEQFWKELDNLRVQTFYIENYISQTAIYDKILKGFLAFSSSSSICGWALWKTYDFYWGLIIAVSQFINAVKFLIPFESRFKSLIGLSKEITALALFAESQWFNIAEGNLSAKEIHINTMNLKKRKSEIINKYFETPLPEKAKFLSKAEEKARIYFKTYLQQRRWRINLNG